MTPARPVLAIAAMVACLFAQAPAENEFARAMQLAQQGRFAEAESSLRGLAKTHPNIFDIRYRLALILLRQGKTEEAAPELEAAIKIQPSSALAWASLAQTRLKLKQRSAALEAADRAAQFGSKDPPVWRALAMVYAEAGEFTRAAEFQELWGKANPGDVESSRRTAELYVEAGKSFRAARQPAKAVEAFQKAFRVDPNKREAYFELATMLLEHRTPQPAVAILETAVSRFPKESEFHRLLGLALYQTGEVQKAISNFCAAVDLDPSAEIGYASFETLLPEAGPQMPQIISRLRSFRTQKPSSPVGHYLLARALSTKEQPAVEIETLLRAAIEADSGFWPAHYELGELLDKQGNAKEALKELLIAAKLNPLYAPAQFSLARLYAAAGDRTKAIEHRKKHHELQARERDEAARARAAAPTLTYRVEAPPNGR